jgi:hypothetical protein
MSASNSAFCFKSSLSFYTNSRRTFSASALARFILTADAIEDSLTSGNCSTNSSFFFCVILNPGKLSAKYLAEQ